MIVIFCLYNTVAILGIREILRLAFSPINRWWPKRYYMNNRSNVPPLIIKSWFAGTQTSFRPMKFNGIRFKSGIKFFASSRSRWWLSTIVQDYPRLSKIAENCPRLSTQFYLNNTIRFWSRRWWSSERKLVLSANLKDTLFSSAASLSRKAVSLLRFACYYVPKYSYV